VCSHADRPFILLLTPQHDKITGLSQPTQGAENTKSGQSFQKPAEGGFGKQKPPLKPLQRQSKNGRPVLHFAKDENRLGRQKATTDSGQNPVNPFSILRICG